MRNLICLLPLFAWTAAAGVAIGPLPAPDYADTEVSTNFVFSVGEGQNRSLIFTVELQGAFAVMDFLARFALAGATRARS